jgi:glycosyltransferase involved in cell wall biosynthesis
MNICILQDFLRNGGTERQTVLLARAFAAEGHVVTVLTFRPGGVLAAGLTAGLVAGLAAGLVEPEYGRLAKNAWATPESGAGCPCHFFAANRGVSPSPGLEARARSDGVAPMAGGTPAPLRLRHVALQPFDTRINGFAPGLARRLRRIAPDVVLCMGRLANGRGALVKRLLPDAVVVGTLRTGKPLQRSFRESLRVVDHVVANSGDSAAALTQAHGVPAERVSVIYNGLVFPADDESGADVTSDRRVKAEAPRVKTAGAVVLLCVGMFRPEKNQRALVEAAARLPKNPAWELWLAGEGPARAECEALARRLGVFQRVRFFGFLSDPTPLYRAADVAVLASRAESLSNFLIEAQAHGLPAVAAEVTGVRECLRVGVSGLVVPAGDAAAMAAAWRVYIENPDARRAAGAAARVFAGATFGPARQVAAYLELFARLRNGRTDLGPRSQLAGIEYWAL